MLPLHSRNASIVHTIQHGMISSGITFTGSPKQLNSSIIIAYFRNCITRLAVTHRKFVNHESHPLGIQANEIPVIGIIWELT
jgi:hypothetical protein